MEHTGLDFLFFPKKAEEHTVLVAFLNLASKMQEVLWLCIITTCNVD